MKLRLQNVLRMKCCKSLDLFTTGGLRQNLLCQQGNLLLILCCLGILSVVIVFSLYACSQDRIFYMNEYSSKMRTVRHSHQQTSTWTFSSFEFERNLFSQTKQNRKHIYLQEEGLFKTLNESFQNIHVVIFEENLLNISNHIYQMSYGYSSNNCSALNKTTSGPVQYIAQNYNSFCSKAAPETLKAVPLSSRLMSLNIGLPNGFSQSRVSSDRVLGFTIVLDGAFISDHGAVTSHNVTLYSYKCHNYEEGKLDLGHSNNRYDEIFIITGHWGWGFYHAFIEDLPRIAPYLHFLQENPHIKIHTGDKVLMSKLFLLLGLSPYRIVTGNVTAKIAYMPSGYPCGYSGIFNMRLISIYLKMSIKPPFIPKRHVLLIKRTTPHRLFLHHDDILQMLHEEAHKRGLEVKVFADNPPPSLEKARLLFYNALMVVGPHGAGLSNMVFCQPGTIIIEGLHHRDTSRAANTCFTTLALALGMRYHGVYFEDRDVLEHTAEDYQSVVQFYLDNVDITVKSN